MIPSEAAPMREDVMQVTDADREAALAVLGGIWSDDEKAVIRQGNRDSLSIIQAFARHRLAHTARPDAPNLNSYIDGYEDAQEVAARLDAGDEVERIVRIIHDECENDDDSGGGAYQRAAVRIATMREGVDRGMVEVPRVLPVFVCDVMTEVKVSDGRGGFTALNWEEAEQVWDAALAALSRKGGRGG